MDITLNDEIGILNSEIKVIARSGTKKKFILRDSP
jgi:hypothetical protein